MRASTRQWYEERIVRAWQFLEENLDEDLHLDRLAEVAGFSPFHFHRIFRGMTGESPQACVRRLRLERAGRALRASERNVIDIALQAGFDSHEGFDRAFRRQFGTSPSDFRDGPGVAVRRLPERAVVFVRHVGPYDEVGEAWQRLMAWAGSRGLFAGIPETVGVVHDDPETTEPSRLRYDAALVLRRPVTPEGDAQLGTLPEGDYAVLDHHGPYSALGESYARLCGRWLPDSGREAAARPSLEFYRNPPQTTPPERLLTEIAVPLV
jgi:AraC family transcriptional regulator